MSEADEIILNLIKGCWPEFEISKEDLARPTQQLAVRFYSNFVKDVNHKIAYLAGRRDDIPKVEFTSEDQLFQEVYKLIKKIFNLKFMLGDIYLPTSIRTRNFFKVCIHFVAFMNQSLNEIDAIGSDVFKKKEEMNKLLIEQEELIQEINENAKVKAEMLEFNKILEEKYKSSEKSYREMMARRAAKEKVFTEKRRQIESLMCDMKNREHELNHLETVKKDLLEKKVTKEEYENISHTLETLKSESKTLNCNDVEIEDVLVNENEVLKHCDDCIRELDKCCDSNVRQNVKKLLSLEEEVKITSNTCEKLRMNKLNPLIQQKLEIEENLAATKVYLANLKSEHKKMVEHQENTLKQFQQDVKMAEQRQEDEFRNNLRIIENIQKDIKKFEDDMEKLKKTLTHEYHKVSKAEESVVDKFKNSLIKYEN